MRPEAFDKLRTAPFDKLRTAPFDKLRTRLSKGAPRRRNSLASRLSARRLIVGGLLDSELGCRVRLQAFVGNGRAAADRATVAAVFDPLEGPIERRESVPQAGGHGVVDSLLCQGLRGISRLTFCLMVISPRLAEIGQQLLHPRTLCVQ
jgi:hypothetical protein